MQDSHPANENPVLDTKAGGTEPYLTKRERAAIAVSIAVSIAIALITIGWEILEQASVGKPQRSSVINGVENRSLKLAGRMATKAPVDPLKLIPRAVSGFTVSGIQRVRGETKDAAEALFKPVETQDIESRPHSVYVRISFHGSERAALNAIGDLMDSRDVRERVEYVVKGIPTTAGYTEDRSSFVAAWSRAGYVFEIDSGYAREVPVSSEGELEKSARAVAEAVAAKMAKGD